MTNPTQAQRSLALDIKMGTFRNGFPVDYNEEELAQLLADHVAEEVAKIEAQKNNAYSQRMMVVRILALTSGCVYGLGKDDNEDWDDAWRNVVYIDLPEGQVSWHIAPDDMHLFEGFPKYSGKWDGKFSGSDVDFVKSVKEVAKATVASEVEPNSCEIGDTYLVKFSDRRWYECKADSNPFVGKIFKNNQHGLWRSTESLVLPTPPKEQEG